jgi:hypothetical protein
MRAAVMPQMAASAFRGGHRVEQMAAAALPLNIVGVIDGVNEGTAG